MKKTVKQGQRIRNYECKRWAWN